MDAVRDFIFGKPITPEEAVKKWRRELQHEIRAIERNIRNVDREEAKVKKDIKAAVKRGDTSSAKTLAREIIRSRKATTRMYNSKAQLNSVSLHLQQNLATYKLAGCIKKSTDVMKIMNNLIKLPQLNQIMMTMAREMEKAGLIEEIMDDILEDDDEEEEADEEVQKVLDGLALDVVTSTPNVPEGMKRPVAAAEAEPEEEDDPQMKDMKERYAALKQGM